MSNFDYDLFDEMVKEAPTAGFGPQVNFGKMTMTVSIIAWKDHKPIITEFTGQKIKDGEYFQLNLESDLSEFNPTLSNPYKRRVDVKKSGDKSKTDWTETVQPAFLKLLGKDWSKKLTKGVYVEWEDAETVELDKDGNKKGFNVDKTNDNGDDVKKHYTNSVPRLLRLFKSKTECGSAREERFTKKDDIEAPGDNDDGIPASVAKQVQGLFKAMDHEAARELLENSKPFGDYTAEELMIAAKVLDKDEPPF